MEYELDTQDIKWAKEFFEKKIDFLSPLNDTEIDSVIRKTRKMQCGQGKTILFQGEFANRLFIIKKGKVGIFVAEEGKKNKVAELAENNYFGEISLVHPVSATATVTAEVDSEILIIAKEDLDVLFQSNPATLETIRKKIEERKAKNKN